MEQYNNELYHYGVKGMKWGVRRYLNNDGTMTRAGKKRLLKEENKDERIQRKLSKKANRYIRKSELTSLDANSYKKMAENIAVKRTLKGKEYTNSFLYRYNNMRMNRLNKRSHKSIAKAEKYIKQMNNPYIRKNVEKMDGYYDPNSGFMYERRWTGDEVMTSRQASKLIKKNIGKLEKWNK